VSGAPWWLLSSLCWAWAAGCLRRDLRMRRSAGRLRRMGAGDMAQIPGVHVETLDKPTSYTAEQIELACKVASVMNRGKLILCEPPEGDE
jgi:hypothetical protein